MVNAAFMGEPWAASIHQLGAFGGQGGSWAHGEVHGGVIPSRSLAAVGFESKP